MKRHKQLWERICAFENITAAAREALLGKRGKVVGARFFADWEREVVRLERELREGSYRPGAYHYFRITDPKLRIVAATVPGSGGAPRAGARDRAADRAKVKAETIASNADQPDLTALGGWPRVFPEDAAA